MKNLIPFVFAIVAAAPALGQAAHRTHGFNCPQGVRISAEVGILKLDELIDQSFSSVSGSRFETVFERGSEITRGCVLIEQVSPRPERFLSIRERADGSLLVSIEGYTPTGKLFSIVLPVDSVSNPQGVFRGSVYDASNTAHRLLGEAQVAFEDWHKN